MEKKMKRTTPASLVLQEELWRATNPPKDSGHHHLKSIRGSSRRPNAGRSSRAEQGGSTTRPQKQRGTANARLGGTAATKRGEDRSTPRDSTQQQQQRSTITTTLGGTAAAVKGRSGSNRGQGRRHPTLPGAGGRRRGSQRTPNRPSPYQPAQAGHVRPKPRSQAAQDVLRSREGRPRQAKAKRRKWSSAMPPQAGSHG